MFLFCFLVASSGFRWEDHVGDVEQPFFFLCSCIMWKHLSRLALWLSVNTPGLSDCTMVCLNSTKGLDLVGLAL